MTTWEYALGTFSYKTNKSEVLNKTFDRVTDMLNFMGRDGWDLVAVSTTVASEKPALATYVLVWTDYEFFYFKRPQE